MEASNFYINLPSNTHTSKEPNTTSQFRVRLPHEIRLNGQWEVALVELQYPRSWNNVSEEQSDIAGLQNNQIAMGNSRRKITLTIWPGFYESAAQLSEAIAEAKQTHAGLKDTWLGYQRLRNKFFYNSSDYKMIIPAKLQYMMGFEHQRMDETTLAAFPPDIRGGMDSLFVYCDLVEPQIVGNSMQQLLRIVPIKGRHGDYISSVFVAPHYIRILRREFSTVEITIKTDTNRLVPFEFGKCIAKLHFRKLSS
jgi:hypothetical protein